MTKALLKNFISKIVEGKPTFSSEFQRGLFFQFLKQFEGQNVWISIDPKIPKRSDRQNSYYWLYLNVIAEETGHSPDDIHEWAKRKFLSHGIKEIFGERIVKTDSTTGLNKNDFTEYIMKIEERTGIPSPDTSPFQLAMTHEEYQNIKN